MKLSFVDSGQLLDFKAIDKENKLTCDDYGQNQTVANMGFLCTLAPSTTVIPPSPQPAAAPTTASIRTAYIGRLVDAGFPAYDTDKSGGLTAPEFAQWVLALYAKAEDANVATRMDGKAKAVYAKNAFATADTDNSKIVSKTEIYSFLIG